MELRGSRLCFKPPLSRSTEWDPSIIEVQLTRCVVIDPAARKAVWEWVDSWTGNHDTCMNPHHTWAAAACPVSNLHLAKKPWMLTQRCSISCEGRAAGCRNFVSESHGTAQQQSAMDPQLAWCFSWSWSSHCGGCIFSFSNGQLNPSSCSTC